AAARHRARRSRLGARPVRGDAEGDRAAAVDCGLRAAANDPPPPCGEGMGVGVVVLGIQSQTTRTPLPSPPPQGGRESSAAPPRLKFALQETLLEKSGSQQ